MTTKDDIERLFRTHYATMYRLAMLILRDDDVSRDIVHDVFETEVVGRLDNFEQIHIIIHIIIKDRTIKID